MKNLKIEEYIPGVDQISGSELSNKDKQALTALLSERHFKKFNPPPDGINAFLQVIRWNEANPWPGSTDQITHEKDMPALLKTSAPSFPKATKKSEKNKLQYIIDCTWGFVEYLQAQGIPGLDGMHLSGRIIALVYRDWNPYFENGTRKGLGGERNYIMCRMRNLFAGKRRPSE